MPYLNKRQKSRLKNLTGILWITLGSVFSQSCGGGNGTDTPPPPASRSFLMGTTPFFATTTNFPDWRFENTQDSDLLSLHLDDFLGVPWDQCDSNGCTPPQAWVDKVTALITSAKATNKPVYLALSPLQDRVRLAPKLDANGNKISSWEPASAIDANGCYKFSTDTNAQTYKNAYISYVKYLIDRVNPQFASPGIEINIPFTKCASQKTAWISWYTDVHTAVKTSYPNIPIFATFQQEHMYGIADTQSSCTGISVAQCYDLRLQEALSIPGDRLAFSTYPQLWKFSAAYNFTIPTDIYSRTRNITAKKIWISETGYAARKILQSYKHANGGVCGADLFPVSIANNTSQQEYMSNLLSQADTHQFEAVIWWLNRDYLDGAVAETCPCSPSTSATCQLAEIFYTADPVSGETLLRLFGNMALREHDGTPRPAYTRWSSELARPRQ